ncbi:MAG: RnfABCDGE type electron transport complex subunit B [Candidatus Omnitrophota bacterium]
MQTLIFSVLTLSILGFLFGIGLAYAIKIFSMQVDPKIKEILSYLPGSNCGACGSAGCFALAEAISQGKAKPTACAPGGEKAHKDIAALLGVEVETKTKQVATVLCGGGKKAAEQYIYQGVKTCTAANMLHGGQKLCPYACLGFGDCVKVCPFDALAMGPEELPIVNDQKCTSCGYCVKECPKHIIILMPLKSTVSVACFSRDKGPVVMKACKAGCIGCKQCEKACKFDAIHVTNNLAVIDFLKCTNCLACVAVCPTKCITAKK